MTLERADAGIAVSIEYGLALYQATAMVTRGWALIEQGQAEEAIEQIRQGLDGHQATGTELLRAHFLGLLAEALRKARRAEEGLRVLEEALTIAHRDSERYYLAELYRLKGELLLQQTSLRAVSSGRSTVSTAENCFNQAIEIAQQQETKSLELRAAMSLAHLYQSQGRHKEAHDALAPVYESFTEGFDTTDLREAKALIAELS